MLVSARLKEDVVDIRKKKRIRTIGIIALVLVITISVLIEASKDSLLWYIFVESGPLPKETVIEQYQEHKEDILKIAEFVAQYEQEDDGLIIFQEVEKFGFNDIIVEQITLTSSIRDIKSQIEKPDLELIQKLFFESKFYEIRHDKRLNSIVFDASAYTFSKWSGILVTLDGKVTEESIVGYYILEHEKIEDNVYFIKCS